MKKTLLILLLTVLSPLAASAQAGRSVFSFLDFPYSARHNADGGVNVSLGNDGDIAFALNNPALLSGSTHNQFSLDYAYFGAAMNFAGAMYGHNWGDNYTGYAIHYLDYGKMLEADEHGTLTGRTFSARDVLIDLIYARQLGPYFRVGASLKPIYSQYEVYSSFALGADVGGYFALPDSSLQIGLTLQNIGWQLKGFYSDLDGQVLEMMPLNLQLGLSYKLKHAPLRFSMTIHNMQKWDLSYNRTTELDSHGYDKWYDLMFRHTVWAVDILPKKDIFWLTLSYNHYRRMNMQVKDQHSLAGFALGAGLHIKSVRVGVALSQYTRSNYVFQTTLSLDINEYLKQ